MNLRVGSVSGPRWILGFVGDRPVFVRGTAVVTATGSMDRFAAQGCAAMPAPDVVFNHKG
jgi:hypothetical protein